MIIDDKVQVKAIIDALRINPVDYINIDDLLFSTKIVKVFKIPSIIENNLLFLTDCNRQETSMKHLLAYTSLRFKAPSAKQRTNLAGVDSRSLIDFVEEE